MRTLVLLFQCQDQKGIVAKISDFILKHNGNIVTADQHSTDPQGGYFFIRVEFVLDEDQYSKKDYPKYVSVLENALQKFANRK